MIALTRSMRHIKTSLIFYPLLSAAERIITTGGPLCACGMAGAKKFKVLKLDYVLVVW
jgi:hypothetical protein